MSHFSRVKTSISNLTILRKALEDLGFECFADPCCIEDSYGRSQNVELGIKGSAGDLLGFAWDGKEYNLVADLQFWHQSISVERFIEKITQQYALNSVLQESSNHGFNAINQEVMQDGAIKLVIQRWN